MRVLLRVALGLSLTAGCASASAELPKAKHPKAATPKALSHKPAASADAATPAPAPEPPPAAAPVVAAPAVLPPVVDGADIPRAALLSVLSTGVGWFLQRIRVQAELDGGRFVGWRVVGFADPALLASSTLQPGDTLLRVNGQSVEHPEQLKTVWDSLATESLLVLQVQRAGQASEIRHRIVN